MTCLWPRLGPANACILRGTTQWTYAIQTWGLLDNEKGPVRGTEGPRKGNKGPVTGTPLLIARNPFNCARCSYGFICWGSRRSLRKAQLHLEDRNLLKLRSLDSFISIFPKR